MIDVDHFKEVDDAHGHKAGDAVLVEFCRIVWDAIREDDYFVRWGGDGFILLLLGLDVDDAVNMGRRIAALVSEHCFSGMQRLTVSMGAAKHQSGKDGIDSWVANRVEKQSAR